MQGKRFTSVNRPTHRKCKDERICWWGTHVHNTLWNSFADVIVETFISMYMREIGVNISFFSIRKILAP